MATHVSTNSSPSPAGGPSAGLSNGASLANTGGSDAGLRRSYPFGAPPCWIYRPSPSPMQSARRTRAWVLEFEPQPPRQDGQTDPFRQLQLSFPTLDAAVGYAERHGLSYRVADPPARRWTRRTRVPEPGQDHPYWPDLLFQT